MFPLAFAHFKGKARLFAILAPLAMALEVAMDLRQPELLSRVIDVGVANGDLGYIVRTGALMLAYALAGFAGGAACSFFAAEAAVTMGGELRRNLFGKIQRLSFAELDAFGPPSLVTRLTNDVMQVQGMATMMLRIMVRAPLIFAGSVVMAFVLSPSLSAIIWVALPVAALAIFASMRLSFPLFGKVQGSLDGLNEVMRENILGARVVKAFGLEDRQAARFDASNDGLRDLSVRAQNATLVMLPVVTFAMNAGVVAVLWFGGRAVARGGFEVGKVMAFVNYLVQIGHSLMMVAMLVVSLSRAEASAKRIGETLRAEPSVREDADPVAPDSFDLEFDGVGFSYGPGAPALDGVSFRASRGQTLGIIGATGSGKTTLVNLIPRLYDARSGRITVGGVDIKRLKLDALRGGIAMVTQESVLFSGDIASNLRFGKSDADDAELARACADAEAAEFVDALPDGRGSRVEQRGKNFSGGQKQRLSIARALVRDPAVLILDDAASAVDFVTEARLRRGIARRAKDKILIVVAQRVASVMDADRILVLDFGRVVASGTHRELLRDCAIYRDIAVSQLGKEALRDVD